MKADLHLHTNFSYDGCSSPEDVVKAAIANGMDAICITDHGEIRGAIEAMKFGFDKNILIIPGIEILTASGDLLGINVKKVIPDHTPIREAILEIRRQGGIASVPHPFTFSMGFFGTEQELLASGPDAIEAFNASSHFGFSNQKASIFIEKNNLCKTAGSDAHRAEFIGRGYLEISGNVASERDLIEAVLQKKAVPQGRPLGFFENIRNASRADVAGLIRYWGLKMKYKNGRG